jgi:hypothetical protein
MRNPISPITETVDDLKLRLQQERDGRKKPRLQMLYLLATGQAHERQDVAALLGVHRHTVGRWLACYATRNHITSQQALPAEYVQRVLSMMHTSGMYDFSGQ